MSWGGKEEAHGSAQLSYSEPEGRFDVNPMIEMWADEWGMSAANSPLSDR